MKKSYEFEVGDHVKYVGDVFPHLKGRIGTVQSIEPASEQVSVKWDNSDDCNYYLMYSLKHVWKDMMCTNYLASQNTQKSKDLTDLIVEIEGMLMKQDKYWSISYTPSSKAYSIYISSEEHEDDK